MVFNAFFKSSRLRSFVASKSSTCFLSSSGNMARAVRSISVILVKSVGRVSACLYFAFFSCSMSINPLAISLSPTQLYDFKTPQDHHAGLKVC